MSTIRCLLADDHALVRAGFRSMLENMEEVRVVAEADNGRDALKLIERHRPDVVLMDIAMPGLNGLEAVEQAHGQFPGVRIVVLSMHANEEYVLRALNAGAAGYVLKDSDPTELALAIRAAHRNETYLSPPVSKQVTDYVRRTGGEKSLFDALTPRQREVLQLIAEGCTNREIAHRLDISVKTVESHRSRLMKRLGIHDIAGLVRYAIQVGLIQIDA